MRTKLLIAANELLNRRGEAGGRMVATRSATMRAVAALALPLLPSRPAGRLARQLWRQRGVRLRLVGGLAAAPGSTHARLYSAQASSRGRYLNALALHVS